MILAGRSLRRLVIPALAAATVVAVGARPAAHAWERWERARWHKVLLEAYSHMAHDGDSMPALALPENDRGDDEEEDDATIRRIYTLAYFGNQAQPDVAEQINNARIRESQRWAPMLRITRVGGAQPNVAVTGQSWVNLGPTDARIQKNGSVYNGI